MAEVISLTSDLQEEEGTWVRINKVLKIVSVKAKNFFVVSEWCDAEYLTGSFCVWWQ